MQPDAPAVLSERGDRTFAVKDPYGYTLWFSQTVAEVVPPAGVKMI